MTNSIGEGVQIGEPIIQYDETDWELLKRLASHFHAVLVSDIMEATPRFSFGLPQGKSYTLPDDVAYMASKDLLAYQKAGGEAAGLHDTDFFTYEIESGEPYAIGDEIWFRNKRMVVSEVRARMERGLFVYTYRLSRIDGIRQGRIHNAKLSGVSLEGKVLAVKGEQVKLHLDIDKQQPKETAYWFPFAPPTGNVMYCMPQVGTNASLYFPDTTGKRAMVLGCVRKNGDSCAKTGNPNIRYFGTEHGSELELAPTALTIVSGCKEPLKLTLDDHVGITLTSHKKLVLNAKEEISLYTPKRVVIQAQSQILAKKTSAPSGFSLESEYHFLGAAVHVEGRDRTTFPAYDDEPKQGTPPPPEPPFDWGKLAVCVVAAVAIVGAVALTVATFGAGAVIGAAAVGAALGAIGGVVMTASSDLIHGEASSPYEYVKSAAQGAVIGAVCGAIFGPVAGIGGGAVVPLTGGQTTVGLGSAMFMGGSSGYIDYSLRELWDGRTPDGGKALESFAFGAALGGAFSVGASWLAKGAERVKGALKRGASSKVEGTGEVPKVSPKIEVNFKTGYDKHLIEVEGFKAKPTIGIKGGHNLENFEKYILDNFGDQVKNINQAVTKTPHPDIPGIYEIKYKLPVYDGLSTANGGKGNFTGQWKEYKNPKTVYDPKVFSDEQILKLGREAIEEGIRSNRIRIDPRPNAVSDEIVGYVEVNGKKLQFIGYRDKVTGEITNFFPVISKN
ncbi:hypothetical protein [Brevibacillus agri]|uniref:CdiA family toxin C-terminal domain-containing protein n=1 Tax=Brevibacillus agri TaxID=51101 RepID=UPI003D751F8C